MHQITGNAQYAKDRYGTLRSMFDQFGLDFYLSEFPIY